MALAIILLVLCCFMPLASFEPRGMGFSQTLYSLVLLSGAGVALSAVPAVLFLFAAAAEVLLAVSLLSYRRRPRQMRLCAAAAAAEILWIAAYVFLCFRLRGDAAPHVKAAAFFPLAALVLTLMARRMVKKDEELVRSADRIR